MVFSELGSSGWGPNSFGPRILPALRGRRQLGGCMSENLVFIGRPQKAPGHIKFTRSFWRHVWVNFFGEASPLRCLLLRVSQILCVRTLEVLDVSSSEMPDASGDFVDDIVVVRHEQYGAVIALQGDVEGVDGFKIEVIGGLIEH